jgi:nitroreductase
MNDIFEIMEKRRSIRKYTDEAVGEDKLLKVLEAARIAPSAKNRQCWNYIVVKDRALLKRLGEATGYNPDITAYEKASYILVLCADPEMSSKRDNKLYYLTDAGISMQQLVLAATALGLGTCWVAGFVEQPVKELLKIPDNIKVVAITPLGYPDEKPSKRERKPMSEMVYKNFWGEK